MTYASNLGFHIHNPYSTQRMFAIPEIVLIAILDSVGGSVAISQSDLIEIDQSKYQIHTEQSMETGNFIVRLEEEV